MRASHYKKKINKKVLWVILGSVFLLIGIGIVTFFVSFHVEEIEVIGNTRYTEQEMKDAALKGPFASNTVLAAWLKGQQETNDIPFVDMIRIERVSNHKLRLLVSEKQVIGYVKYLDCDMFFDKNGIVVESIVSEQPAGADDPEMIAPEELETILPEEIGDYDKTVFHAAVRDVPLVEGLVYNQIVLEEILPVKNKQVFNTVLGIARMMEKMQLTPDKVSFDEKHNITMHFGTIEVTLGQDTLLEEKITRMAAILPELSGRVGVLHLEEYTDGTTNIIFSDTKLEQEIADSKAEDELSNDGESDADADSENDEEDDSDVDDDDYSDADEENQDDQEDAYTEDETAENQNE